MSEEVEHHILRKYTIIKKLGSGAYGHVWKVTDKKTSQVLALKKIFDAFQHSTDAQRTFRQIVILHELNHPNIIKLSNVIKAENDKDLYLVFQFMEADLHNAIGQKILKDIHNRFIIYQIVKGIKFLHSAQIIHRDLKPSNVLLNSDCHLKICDFGLARSLVADKEGTDMILTQEVATRWYRAPQVLLGSQTYEKSADIWSIGCILGQILIGKPMFPGNSTLNQLQRIISFTGNPSKQDIHSLNSQVAISMISTIPQSKPKPPKQWFKPDTPSQAITLLNKMLQFNPKKRLTADQILKHPYLAQFHNSKEQYQSNKIIYPPVSDNKKLNLKQYRQLIYQRIKKIYKGQQDNTNGNISGNIGNTGSVLQKNSLQRRNSHDHSSTNHSHSQHHSSNNTNNAMYHGHQHRSITKQQSTNSLHHPYTNNSQQQQHQHQEQSSNNNNGGNGYHQQQPIRHSTGKMKTTSYSSSCSSFAQFHNNASNNNNNSNSNTYNNFYGNSPSNNISNNNGNPSATGTSNYNSLSSYQYHHQPSSSQQNYNNNYQGESSSGFTSTSTSASNNNQNNSNNISNNNNNSSLIPSAQQYIKIHKKSSLKQILKNKKYKEQSNNNNSISIAPSKLLSATMNSSTGNIYQQHHHHQNQGGFNMTHTGVSSSGYNNNGTGSSNVQKYYKKSVGAGGIGVGASLYKQNKIGRHV